MNKIRPILEFPAEILSGEEQFEAMRSSVAPITEIQLGKSIEIDQFTAESTWCLLDELIISQSCTSALCFRRDKRTVGQNDDIEHYIFHLSLAGNYVGVAGQTDLRSGPGSITVMDTREEIYGQSDDCNLLTIVMPRHLVEHASELQSMTMAPNNVKTRVFREHILTLWNTIPDMTTAEYSVFSRGLVALTNALFNSDKNLTDTDSAVLEQSLLASIKTSIEKNLLSPHLGVVSLCRTFHCSRAALYRIFKPCGGIARYVRERRLVAAFKVLSSSRGSNQRIIDVALQHGFSNQSIFSRLFRQYFGITPSDAVMLGNMPYTQPRSTIQTTQHIAHWLKSL